MTNSDGARALVVDGQSLTRAGFPRRSLADPPDNSSPHPPADNLFVFSDTDGSATEVRRQSKAAREHEQYIFKTVHIDEVLESGKMG